MLRLTSERCERYMSMPTMSMSWSSISWASSATMHLRRSISAAPDGGYLRVKKYAA